MGGLEIKEMLGQILEEVKKGNKSRKDFEQLAEENFKQKLELIQKESEIALLKKEIEELKKTQQAALYRAYAENLKNYSINSRLADVLRKNGFQAELEDIQREKGKEMLAKEMEAREGKKEGE